MLGKKIRESLTARIFLITALILLGAGAITFGLIAWATPSTYTAVVNDELAGQVDALAEELSDVPLEECGPALDAFLRTSGADAVLVGPDGQAVDTGSRFAAQPAGGYQAQAEDGGTVTYITSQPGSADAVAITTTAQATIASEVYFSGRTEAYTLYVTPRLKAENLAVQALVQMAPWLLLALLCFSLLCALAYSRYITRPILHLSAVAGKMAELDFGWTCEEGRQDEIGRLGRSLNQMAGKLSGALCQLKASNEALRGEVALERELDRQRMAFFNAASHELKTPVTILKGQLAGMLDGVDVYRDRETYLARSLQVTARMEALIGEMLAISRMEAGSVQIRREPVELSALLEAQLALDRELLQQRGQRLAARLTPGLTVTGDPSLLGKAAGNLLSNASLYSPEGAEIRVWCGLLEGRPALTVENTEAHIQAEALPHLFEAFYRTESSRSRRTGGSGLGLYLVKMILDRHGAKCSIENTEEGVRAAVRF